MSQAAPSATTPTRRYFEKRAEAFDRLYRRSSPGTWWLRRGPRRSRDFAVTVVARQSAPSVLDVGCGPGRVGEAVIEAGARSYTGIDFSAHMLELARARLGRFDSVELVEGDFHAVDMAQTFDVVLALGLFDYLDEPVRAAEWMRPRCGGTLVATFSRRDRIKTPIRRFHYELVHRCPLYFYKEPDAEATLRAAGFSSVEVAERSRRGFFVVAAP
ncbi:MAG TPA: class I SAM-dependent methyltransferase [Gaiellaceae bacterium]|nr:class I SAM-dependent methyltransferase [Gaiellaceae bacterium]